MGCDWSKSASSFEDLQDAPYALLSVSVEEAAYKAGKRSGGTKKRDKKKSRDASGNVEVPKPSSQIAEDGVHRSGLPSLGANRRRDETDVPNKENAPGLGGLGFGGKLGLGLKLDLTKALNQGREPTERQLRKEKLDRYENECTQIEDYMYVGGMIVAKNKELLKRVGITHIINCSAITTENFFPDSFTYKAIYMNDSPGEDIACHIYSVAAVIDEVRRKGQKVLVHCTQGVSRSCSFCIAYLMLKEKMSYDDGFQRLKTRRGICNPNPGFCSQLVRWGRRIQAASSTTALSYQPRLFRLDYYYPANDKAGVAPMLVERKGDKPVPKYVLITAAVYIVDTPECLFVWIGTGARGEHTTAADFAVESLQKYEGSPMVVERCAEGEESQHMLDVLHELRYLSARIPAPPARAYAHSGTYTRSRTRGAQV
jgi:protein-tyrosine phosphatase